MNKLLTPNERAVEAGQPDRIDDLISLQIQQIELLQTVDAKVTVLLEVLTPKDSDGPTLDDIIARLVELLGEQRPILRRIDNTTGRSLDVLEGRPVRAPDERGEPA